MREQLCYAEGCLAAIPLSKLFCDAHWDQVSEGLQGLIAFAQADDRVVLLAEAIVRLRANDKRCRARRPP